MPGEEEDGVCSDPSRDLQAMLERQMKKNPRMNKSVLGIQRTAMFQNLKIHNEFVKDQELLKRPQTTMFSPTGLG